MFAEVNSVFTLQKLVTCRSHTSTDQIRED